MRPPACRGETLSGIPRVPGGIPAGCAGADRDFYAIADRYLDDLFRAHPAAATVAGHHRYDGLLDDWGASAVRARVEQVRRYRRELERLDPARLSPGARIDHGILRSAAESELLTATDLRPHEHDPQFHVDLLGNAVLFLTLQGDGSSVWPERLEALRGRLLAVPDFLATARASLAAPARVVTDLVLQTNAGNLRFIEESLPPLFDRAPALAPLLREANARACAALREFQDWLRRDLLPRSTGDWRLGRDLWTRKLRLTLQSDLPPEDILRRAEAAIAETRRRMLDVAHPLHARLFPDHAHRETGEERIGAIVGEVLSAIAIRHPTRDTLFDCVRAAIGRIRRFIRETDLVTLPPEDDNFAIEPTPGFLDGVAVAFFNPPPILEPGLKKSFWISSVPRGATPEEDRGAEESFLREYNDYALQGLVIHEAFPGHYVQYWHALRSPLATVYKKVFSSGTFAEGWAVLAESLMFEAGYAKDEPENLLVHLKHQLRAPINALIDARLHAGGEPDEEVDRWAIDLLVRGGFQEEAEARGKLRRAKVTSAQLSTYFAGYLEMRDLLEDAGRAAGPSFRLRDVNDRILSFGTIPPRDVRALMGLA
jgi:uncharacterized protein (DUF885 family)